MPERYRIGRMPRTGPLAHSFDIAFDPSKRTIQVLAEDDDHGPSQMERTMIMRHYATPVTVLAGGEKDGKHYDGPVTVHPGNQKFFDTATHMLPPPFYAMPRARKAKP